MAPSAFRSRRRVLVVDDESVYRTTLAEYLADEGYHVIAVRDGMAALEVLDHFLPDVILLDGQMPRLDGVSFLHAYARRDGAHAPVIFCSSDAIDPAATTLGVKAIIRKPCDLDALVDAVRGVIASVGTIRHRRPKIAAVTAPRIRQRTQPLVLSSPLRH